MIGKILHMRKLNMYFFHRNNRVHHIKHNSKIAVNYFQNRRWQLVPLLEQLCGLWPYQSQFQQYPLQLFYSFISLSALSATLNEFRESIRVDTNVTIECCLFTFIFVGLLVKLIFSSIGQNSRRKAYKRIAKHFQTMSDPEEIAILKEGAEGAFKYTTYYMSIISIVMVIFNIVPILRSFYGYLFNHCELRVQIPLKMNFGFDHSKYWYIIALHFLMWCYSAILLQSAHDLSFMLQVRHVAALFNIVGIRLRKTADLADEFENENMSNDAADQSYSIISSAIDLHSECFEIVKRIEKFYTTCWFIILLLSTAGFGAGIHVISTKLHDPIETLRYASVFMIVVLHFQMVFSEGQLIIDSAKSVSDACCECKWYGLPKKSCKLLTMMLIRTSIPCQLTGAKLFPLSMESFSKMLKAGLSYCTVFSAK